MKSNVYNIHEGEDGLRWLSFPDFDSAGMINGISTRHGGASKGYFGEMNFSRKVGDDPAAVAENYRIFTNALGSSPDSCVASMQTHTAKVMIVTEKDAGSGVTREHGYSDVDGLVTNVPNILLVIHTADCVPVFLAEKSGKAVALVHSGWRGTVSKISAVAIEKMKNEFGCDPKDIICGIGPAICKDCFEVDKPVVDEFCGIGFDESKIIRKRDGVKWDIDLTEAVRETLMSSGIPNENITVGDLCTVCNHNDLHSHRATGGKRGVIGSFLGIKK